MGVLWNFFAWLKSNAGSITAICAFFATIFALKAWKVSKNTIRNEIIGSLLKEYRSPEMGVAIRRLYDFYRECKKDESKLIEEYEARYKAGKYEDKDSLHNQQRLVTNFYQHMTALVSLKIINSDLFYEIWDKSSLEIIPNILIPIGAKAIPSVLGEKPGMSKASEQMMAFYKNAPERRTVRSFSLGVRRYLTLGILALLLNFSGALLIYFASGKYSGHRPVFDTGGETLLLLNPFLSRIGLWLLIMGFALQLISEIRKRYYGTAF